MHSRKRIPVFAAQLAGVALLAWIAGALYTIRLNPEITFFRHAHELKQEWGSKMNREFPQKVVVFGGSSCLVSIDGASVLSHQQLPILNLGLGAGMGARVLTEYALQQTRAGDTLVMAMEHGLLTTSAETPAMGVQFCYAIGQSELLDLHSPASWIAAGLDLRPSAYHVFTLLGKIVLRQPLYRYTQDEVQPGGWHRLYLERPFNPEPLVPLHPSSDATALLSRLRVSCVQKSVRLAYSMPWEYIPPDRAEQQKKINAAFLVEICEYVSVLKDPRLGVHTTRSDFADTMWHLKPKAAELRSRELAQQVQQWALWSKQELQQQTHEKMSAQD